MILQEFINYLDGFKDELKNKEVFVFQKNRTKTYPECKFVLKGVPEEGLTNENVHYIIIT